MTLTDSGSLWIVAVVALVPLWWIACWLLGIRCIPHDRGLDDGRRPHQNGVLDHVSQFPNVPGPSVVP